MEKKYSRYHSVHVLGMVTIYLALLMRIILLIRSWNNFDHTVLNFLRIFGIGFLFDILAGLYMTIPSILYLLFVPNKLIAWKWHKIPAFALLFFFTYINLFSAISEWIFWDEFNSRYNFIAVDYLVYTQEIVQNIRESYPVGTILTALGLLTAAIIFFFRKNFLLGQATLCSWKKRFQILGIYIFVIALEFIFVRIDWAEKSGNNYVDELSKNGIYSIFSAYRNNSLDYEKFYPTRDANVVSKEIRALLNDNEGTYIKSEPFHLERKIQSNGAEKHMNVMLITVESLSAKFMEAFGSKDGPNLTPNLDALSKESLFFTKLYATGTRTVRGLEAITLALPPTPGNSIVRRPENKDLASLGSIFAKRKYDVKFIYGGYGYFDNMNDFFANNGYEIIDRNNFSKEETTFGNAWGLCDEDLLNKSLAEADKSFANKKPFFSMIMTTSNHRPYTYPQKVDIKSGTVRQGAVKYTDFAIGEFLKMAKTKPWFANTIFVVIADHTASSSGKIAIPVNEYHIPLLIYAPHHLKAKRMDRLMSQTDFAPTLLGLLNFNYEKKFFGTDVFKNEKPRALLGTYQKIGLYQDDMLAVLFPPKKQELYSVNPQNFEMKKISPPYNDKQQTLIDTAITYYQSASHIYKSGLYKK